MDTTRCSSTVSGQSAVPSVATLSRDPFTERNARVKARYDELMHEGKHGHYETMFRVVREEVTLAQNLSYLRGQVDQYDDPLSPETIERFRRALVPQTEPVSPGSAPNTDGPEYRCVNGHDRCNQMYPGPTCPYCERVDAPRQNTADPEGSE